MLSLIKDEDSQEEGSHIVAATCECGRGAEELTDDKGSPEGEGTKQGPQADANTFDDGVGVAKEESDHIDISSDHPATRRLGEYKRPDHPTV